MIKKLLLGILLMCASVVYAQTKTAVFAGGCFWCMQSDFDKVKGVVKTIAGYDGGTQLNPTYGTVSSGKTNYAESLEVVYNPKVVTYKQLLNYFWRHIDPTVKDAQFCDHGKQYRSAIFYVNNNQKQQAIASIKQVKKLFPNVYTQVVASTKFYAAEKYHQDYYKKNPIRYKYYRWNCGRDARVEKVWKGKYLVDLSNLH